MIDTHHLSPLHAVMHSQDPFQHGGVVTLLLDADASRIIAANANAALVLGRSESELLGLDTDLILSASLLTRLRSAQPTKPAPLQHTVADAALRIDGGDWVQAPCNCLTLQYQQADVHVLNFAKEDVQRTAVWHRAAQEFEQLLANFPDAIIVQVEGRVLFANDAMAKYLGVSAQELANIPIAKLIHASDYQRLQKLKQAAADEACPHVTGHVRFLHADGELLQTQLHILPIRHGGVQSCVLIARDTTQVVLLRQRSGRERSFRGLLGRHAKMNEAYDLARQVARTDISVLITGETGTGKEVLASAIHLESRRAAAPFVPVNCGALPEGLVESELFGHVRGAFTGAVRDKKGRFEIANGGTLFLDEVGELSPAVQVKLLRALEDGHIIRVGAEQGSKVDVRVLAATNRDLHEQIRRGLFRHDLYFRLGVVPIHLPALRERGNDLELLAEHFLSRFAAESERPIPTLTQEAIEALYAWRWPGNVRELMNALQYAMVRTSSHVIEAQHLPPEILQNMQPKLTAPSRDQDPGLSREQLNNALRQVAGNKVKAAQLLGIGRSTLYRYMRQYAVSTAEHD